MQYVTQWWHDLCHGATHFYHTAGQQEISVVVCATLALCLLCLRGFAIR